MKMQTFDVQVKVQNSNAVLKVKATSFEQVENLVRNQISVTQIIKSN